MVINLRRPLGPFCPTVCSLAFFVLQRSGMKAHAFTTTISAHGCQELLGPAAPYVQELAEDSGVFHEEAVGKRQLERSAELAAVKQQYQERSADFTAAHSLLAKGPTADPAVTPQRALYETGLAAIQRQSAADHFGDRDMDSLLAMGGMASSALKSGYEGWSSFKAADWWSMVVGQVNAGMRLFSENAIPPKVERALGTLVDTARAVEQAVNSQRYDFKGLADRAMQGILGLPVGESFCLVGGWSGQPGHAMVYRFEKKTDGLFNVYVYNAQGDSPQSEGGRRTEGRLLSRPCYVFENVTCADLFFAEPTGFGPAGEVAGTDAPPNSVILRRLLELNIPPPPEKKYSMADVLDRFCRLTPKLVPGNKFRNLFIRAQRVGNCAVKCVNCLLLDMLGELPDGPAIYKRLNLDERLCELMDYSRKFCQPPYDASSVRDNLRRFGMLRRAARNFLTILDKNFKRGTVTRDAYEVAFATVNQILSELKTSEATVRGTRRAREDIPDARPVPVSVRERTERGRGVWRLSQVARVNPSDSVQFSLNPELGKAEPWSQLPQTVARLKEIVTSAAGTNYDPATISQFEITMRNLFERIHRAQTERGDGSVRLDGLAPEQAAAVQADLVECQKFYLTSVYRQNGTPSVRVQNAGMQALALSLSLARWSEGPAGPLSSFGLYTRHFEGLSGNPNSVYAPQDGDAVVQRNALMDFWRRVNAGARSGQLFNLESQEIGPRLVEEDKIPELSLYNHYKTAMNGSSVETWVMPMADRQDWHGRIVSEWYSGYDQFTKQRLALFVTGFGGRGFPQGMAHIGALKQTALLAFELFAPGAEQNYGGSIDIYEPPAVVYSSGRRVWRTSGEEVLNFARLDAADYPRSKPRAPGGVAPKAEAFDYYARNRQHRHLQGGPTGIQPENDVLVDLPTDEVSERDLALSEPGVQTSLLFDVVEDNLLELSKPAWRAQIEAECFKTVEKGGVTVSPLCEQLQIDDALIGKLDHLTDCCLRQLVEAAPQAPKWQEMLFVLRLRANVFSNLVRLRPAGYRLSRQPPELNSVAVNERIFKWLKDYDLFIKGCLDNPATPLTVEARDSLLLVRRELALTRAGMLLGLPTDELDLDQRAELFDLMMTVNKDYQAFSRVESRSFLRECQHRFVIRSDIWRIPPGSEMALAEKIIRGIDPGFIGRPGWRLEGGCRLVMGALPATPDAPPQDGYVIDLTRPMIFKNDQELSRATFSVTEEFRRLFESRQFEVRQEGPDIVSFNDEKWGHIEVRGRGKDTQIWRFYPHGPTGKWYIYRRGRPDEFKGHLQINDALCFDHVHWFQPETQEVLIFDLRDGSNPLYRVVTSYDGRRNPDGTPVLVATGQYDQAYRPLMAPQGNFTSRLIDCQEERKWLAERERGVPPLPGSLPLEFCLLQRGFNAAVERFEDIGEVNAWTRREGGGRTEFSHIEFPRFRMQDGCLRFDRQGDDWVYAADRRFKISKEPTEPLLDTNSRYLHLVQEEPDSRHPGQMKVVKRKVLIPSGRVRAAGFEQYAQIDLKSGENDGNKLSLKYFEYDYDEEKNELVPTTLEARVYLAHLYLGQKRYQEAREVLKKISMSAQPSAEAVQLLRDMLGSGEGLSDLSPSACAVRMYAYLIFKKIKPREKHTERLATGTERIYYETIDYETIDYETIGDLSKEHKRMADVYKAYLFGVRAVETPLLFDPETEWEIFKFLKVGDELAWRRTDLLREIAQNLGRAGVSLTPDHQAATQVVSPTEVWELPVGGGSFVWPDLRCFIPDWPSLFSVEEVQRENYLKLPYSEGARYGNKNYVAFSQMYERIRRARPLEREGILFELLADSSGFSNDQINLFAFLAGHPAEPLFAEPLPAEGDLPRRHAWCEQLFEKYRRYAIPGSSAGLPALRASFRSAAALPAQARAVPLPPDLPPAAPPAPFVPMVNAGWETRIAGWQTACLTPRPPSPSPSPHRKSPVPEDLTRRERAFGEGVGNELGRYVQDRETARLNEAQRPLLQSGFDPRMALLPGPPEGPGLGLEKAIADAKLNEESLRGNILALARKLPVDSHAAIVEQVVQEGGARPDLDINTILRAAAIGLDALRRLNLFLTAPELESLRSVCLDFMVVTTTRQHIERIMKPLVSWRDALDAGRPIDPQWEMDFVDALAQPRTYNPYDAEAKDYFPLLFEYMSGMRVWGNQASIIQIVLEAVVVHNDAQRQNIVFQRIMAGGKTSVIISALLELISQTGQLPLVLCHHSQYASVSGNLHNFQESRYDKDVYAIDYDIKQLGDPEIVQEIIAKINEADRRGCALLMKSSMPQVIELKFVMEALRLTEIRGQRQEYARRVAVLEVEARGAVGASAQQDIGRRRKELEDEIEKLGVRQDAIMRNVGLLAQVIKIFKAKGVGVLDECDIILSMLMEVNVPIGEEEMLTPERAELVREIYQSLVSDDVLPRDPRLPPDQPDGPPVTIRQFVDLEHNNQAKLSEADFNARVAPFVANKLFDNRALRLDEVPELRAAFGRYIADHIQEAQQVAADRFVADALQRFRGAPDWESRLEEAIKALPSGTPEEGDIKFLCYLSLLKRSTDKYRNAAADKIALSGRIVRDVLQLALSRSCDRSYGRDPGHDNGMVIPFLGVNAPATTRFGYVYLALCYQFQAALNKPISVGELEYLARKLGEAAQDYAKKGRDKSESTFEEQPEAKWFFEVTGGAARGGVRLTEALKDERIMRRACEQINSDPRRKLEVEAEIAPFHVRYYKERVSSNPINLAEQLRKMFGCSGTPWNWHSYHRKVGDLEADRGVEGKIMNAMLERASRDGQPYAVPTPYPHVPLLPGPPNIYRAITTLADDGLQPILDHLRHHPQRNRVRALIDAGGFLKGTNNAQAAEAILQLHHDPAFCAGQPPAIDAVICLHQFSAEEVAAGKPHEKFVILKRMPDGTVKREELPDTSAATIANCGIPKDRIFVLFDELRATGTDIPMADDTICLQTVDARMPVRTLLQAALRARRYFQGQDCEFLVTQKGRAEMLNRGASLQDVVDTLIKNQAVADGDQTFRSYLAQITNSVRVATLQRMLAEDDPQAVAAVAEQQRSFLVASFVDDPYQQFARVVGSRRTADILFNHAENTLFAYYQRRLVLDARAAPRPGEAPDDGRARAESLAPALREYIRRLLMAGQVLDRRELLAEAGKLEDPGLSPVQRAKGEIYRLLCNLRDEPVENSILAILGDAQKRIVEGVLPPELRYRQGADIDAQVEVEREVDVEIAVEEEREQEMKQELQQELNTYNLINGARKYVEGDWRLPPIGVGTRLDLAALGGRDKLRSVSSVCTMAYPPPVGNKQARFERCFPPHLFMTENLRNTFEHTDLPLLHRKMKNASFMLVIDSEPPGQPACVLLSKKDAVYFKAWIRQYQPSNAWLINMKGVEEITNPGHPLMSLENSMLRDALWAANLFNGNVQYLESHRRQTIEIFEHVDPAVKQSMCDFVVMRGAFSPRKKKAALTSDLIVPSDEVREKRQGVVFGPRRRKVQEQYERIRSLGADADWVSFDPVLVPDLRDTQLQYLVTAAQLAKVSDHRLQFLAKKSQVSMLTNTRLRFLKPAQIGLLSADQIVGLDGSILGEKALLEALNTKELVALVPREKVKYLASNQADLLSPDVVASLRSADPDEVRLLQGITDRQLFQRINDPGFIQHVADGQVSWLASEQLPLIGDAQVKNLRLADVSRWPRTAPNIWRLAMVKDAAAIPPDLRDGVLKLNVNTFAGLGMADIASWLISSLDAGHMQPLAAAGRLDEIDGNQARRLPPDLVKHLRKRELVQALQTPEQIREVHNDAVQYLTPPQRAILSGFISRLDVGSLGQLPQWCNAVDLAWPRFRRLTPEEFRALRPDQQQWAEVIVKALNPEQLAQIAASPDPGAPEYLSAHYLPNLTPTQLSGLGDRHRALVARMTKPILQRLQRAQVDLVPANRLSELDPGQYGNIMEPGLLREAIGQHLIRRDLRQEQLQRVREVDALLELENVDIGQLLPEQKQMLTEQLNRMNYPTLQATLLRRPWAIDLAVGRVLGLPEDQFQSLQATRVGRQITDKLTALINGQQIPQIKEWLQRGRLAPHYLDLLSQAQLDVADAYVVNMLRPVQIQRLKAPQVKMLTADPPSNRIDQILPIQVPMLDDGQIQHLRQPALVQAVAGDKVGFIERGSRQHINDPAKLLRLPDVTGLDDHRLVVSGALGRHIGGLRPDQLRTIGVHFADYCWPAFCMLDEAGYGQLSPEQQTWISTNKIPGLPTADLAADRLNEHYLRFLDDDQVTGLTVDDRDLVNRLPWDRLHIVNDPAVLRVVDKQRQADYFSDLQIRTMYPRNAGVRFLALVGLVLSSLFVVPLLFLFSSTYRDWWRLAVAGVWSRDSYIAARRVCLRH